MTLASNPLLKFDQLPAWADIKPEHVAPAMDFLLNQSQKALNQVCLIPLEQADWDNTIEFLTDNIEQLTRAWGAVNHLHHVIDDEQWRIVFNQYLPIVTDFWTQLGQSEALMSHYLHFHQHPEQLSSTRQRVIDNNLKDFKLSGALLEGQQKTEFAQLTSEEASLKAKFAENVLDATNIYSYYATLEELIGVPEDTLDIMKEAAQDDEKEGYKISLHFPSYFPVLQYAQNRDLRKRIYQAHVTRASDLGDPSLDNTPIIKRLLAIRKRQAQLLGFQHFADLSLESKMATNSQEVCDFLLDMANKAKPFAINDYQALKIFAQNHLGIEDLQAWDVTYASEKLRQEQYSFSEHEIKSYFPLRKVMDGLFKVIHGLFGIEFRPAESQIWHEDVLFYQLFSAENALVGGVYLDPFARSGKSSGAWMDEVRVRRHLKGQTQTPIAHMVTNFAEPLECGDSYLYHDDIITLFHETGHAMHHLLTQVGDYDVAGIRGVEWDAVELPSQFMENFCWDYDILCSMSEHEKTKAPLPKALFDKMLAAKNFQSGLDTLRQIEFGLFDMQLHMQTQIDRADLIDHIHSQVRAQVTVIPNAEFNRFTHSFSHVFAGGYSAGYYSYKWAEVLSADAFSAFEEAMSHGQDLINRQLGLAFWREILAVGGSRPALDSFIAFRQREPQSDALMRHGGMDLNKAAS